MQTLDWVVIAGYGLGMLFIGWYFSRKTASSKDYYLGGRQMKPWAVGLSLFATLFSAISYLSCPGEMIRYGPMMYSGMIVAYPLVFLIIGWLLIPSIMSRKFDSAYELLEIRLGLSVRVLASVLFLAMRLIWMGLIIYMCAERVIVPIMGWSQESALWVSIVMGILTVAYTSMGGLRAVVWTDVAQTLILAGAAILAIIVIGRDTGGVAAWVPERWPDHWLRWTFFDMKARVSFVSSFLAFFSWQICTAGSDAMAIQRYLATRDAKGARMMFLISMISNVLVIALLVFVGLGLLAYFQVRQDLLPEGRTLLDAADEVFPRFIVAGLPAGLTGLALAGLFAAAMSSLSSGVNSSSQAISKDLIPRFFRGELSQHTQVQMARFLSLGIGMVIVSLSMVMGYVQGNLTAVTNKTVNLLVAPLFVPFFMALYVRGATSFATFWGTLASIVVAVLISFSHEFFGTGISFLWVMPVSFVVGVLVSMSLSMVNRSGRQE